MPVCAVGWQDGLLVPLHLRVRDLPVPPRGPGNAALLRDGAARQLGQETAGYLKALEDRFGARIERVAIDAPRAPSPPGANRRSSEAALARDQIQCFTTPTQAGVEELRAKALGHLATGGDPSRLPFANKIWMLAGFALFEVLGREWECLEVFPQATARVLGAGAVHKSKPEGLLRQLEAAARHTGWPRNPVPTALKPLTWAPLGDSLDAYLSAWVAALEPERRVCYGGAEDAIWVPRVPSS